MRKKHKNAVEEKTKDNDPAGFKKWASAMGRMGGQKGGYAAARKLTKRQRQRRAKLAADARWLTAKKKRQKTT